MLTSGLVAAVYVAASAALDRLFHWPVLELGIAAAVLAAISGILSLVASRWSVVTLVFTLGLTVLGVTNLALYGGIFVVVFLAPLLLLLWTNYQDTERRYRDRSEQDPGAA